MDDAGAQAADRSGSSAPGAAVPRLGVEQRRPPPRARPRARPRSRCRAAWPSTSASVSRTTPEPSSEGAGILQLLDRDLDLSARLFIPSPRWRGPHEASGRHFTVTGPAGKGPPAELERADDRVGLEAPHRISSRLVAGVATARTGLRWRRQSGLFRKAIDAQGRFAQRRRAVEHQSAVGMARSTAIRSLRTPTASSRPSRTCAKCEPVQVRPPVTSSMPVRCGARSRGSGARRWHRCRGRPTDVEELAQLGHGDRVEQRAARQPRAHTCMFMMSV